MTAIDFSSPDHPLVGARSAGYPGVGKSTLDGLTDHEARIGRRVHLGMSFARPGMVPVSKSGDVAIANREATALIQCWKPARWWREAGGNNAAVSAYFTTCAEAVRDAGGDVIMVIHHEPENDVHESGTAVEYKAMWKHVRRVFDDNGADPLWGIGYMNYPKWDYLVPQLYPDDGVDWIFMNGYGSPGRDSWSANVSRFLDKFATTGTLPSDGVNWGVREWGTRSGSSSEAVEYFIEAKEHVRHETFPALKAHVVFDSPGTHGEGELRISLDAHGRPDPGKEKAYRDFAHLHTFGPVTSVNTTEPQEDRS